MSGCAVSGCGGSAAKRGWCIKHYTRFIRHGDPEAGGYGRGHAKEWLTEHVGWAGDGCLIWPFYRDPNGYARISSGGRDQVAARVMCRMVHGEPPTAAHQAAHSCGRGHEGCIHPKHIRWATPHENQMDKVDHGTAARGEKAWNSKLTEADVRRIRRLIRIGISQRQIAPMFDVHQGTIAMIAKKKSWGWLQ